VSQPSNFSNQYVPYPLPCQVKDIRGRLFGHLIAINYLGTSTWQCRCVCGNSACVSGINLTIGKARSCGCKRGELRRQRMIVNRTRSGPAPTHGLSKFRIHATWAGMKERCLNTKSKIYRRYGARGITIEYQPWIESFVAFRDWAYANGYADDLVIDRIDNSRGYSPENCRFVTIKGNSNNSPHNHKETAFGETKNLTQWGEDPRCVVPMNTLKSRMRCGWPIELALTKPSILRTMTRAGRYATQ
jgi:hypothetical protein